MKISKSLLKTKLKASGIHFGLSLLIFAVLAYQIYYLWYPMPYFLVDGGWQGMRLVAAVDLVLGPLITFLIFDLTKSKRAIIFDLVVIATIQIGALAYGVATTYQQRPVAVVLIDQFFLSTVADSYGMQINSLDELKKFSEHTPPLIFADIDQTREAVDEVLRIKIEDNIPEASQLHLYKPQSMMAKAFEMRQPGYTNILGETGASKKLEEWLQKNEKQREDVFVAPFNGRYGLIWLIFDRKAQYLDYI
jgi:hypothetical protein